MVRKILPICFMACIAVSCDNDFEESKTATDSSLKQIDNDSVV